MVRRGGCVGLRHAPGHADPMSPLNRALRPKGLVPLPNSDGTEEADGRPHLKTRGRSLLADVDELCACNGTLNITPTAFHNRRPQTETC